VSSTIKTYWYIHQKYAPRVKLEAFTRVKSQTSRLSTSHSVLVGGDTQGTFYCILTRRDIFRGLVGKEVSRKKNNIGPATHLRFVAVPALQVGRKNQDGMIQ
jgi:hypothetical protein